MCVEMHVMMTLCMDFKNFLTPNTNFSFRSMVPPTSCGTRILCSSQVLVQKEGAECHLEILHPETGAGCAPTLFSKEGQVSVFTYYLGQEKGRSRCVFHRLLLIPGSV